MKAILGVEQDKIWTKLFEIAANEGATNSEADKRAWTGLCEQFPELRSFDGCEISTGRRNAEKRRREAK